MKTVVITGATGTIGREVCGALLRRGDKPIALSRNTSQARATLPAGVEVAEWSNPTGTPPPVQALTGADAVINLIGETISQRWTEDAKRRIRESRVAATRMLVSGLRTLNEASRPAVLVSQSATGYYGPSDGRELAEDAPGGSDFLAGVVRDWEAAAMDAADITRVAVTRTGVVLSPSGGALAKMLPFFRLGVGGPVAGGHQYVPWVHLDDVVNGLIFCVDTAEAKGAVNMTAPTPIDNATLSHTLGRVLHRPAFLPVPGFLIHTLYGDMAELVTTGQRAVPKRLLELGYEFRQPELEPALRDVLAGDSGSGS